MLCVPLTKKLGLINEERAWYSAGKIKSFYENDTSVPWISNRAEKLKEKIDMYEHIIIGYRLNLPYYIVDQVTLIMDVFGGYDNNLIRNIEKVLDAKRLIDSVIKDMQKSVISSCAYLSRAFKFNTM